MLAVALTAAGLLAGCSSTTSSSHSTGALAPKGAGSAAGTQSAPATPASLSPSASPVTSAPVASPSGTSATSSPEPASTAGNGTQLGAYSINLTNGYAAPLAATAPTQAEMTTNGSCDIQFGGVLYSCNSEKMISLPSGTTPTYSACTTGTIFENEAPATQGTAFCLIEGSGRVAGLTVATVGSSSAYVNLKVTVWQYVS